MAGVSTIGKAILVTYLLFDLRIETSGQCIPENYLYHHWHNAQAFRGDSIPCYHPAKFAFSLWPFAKSGNLTIKGVIPLYRFRHFETGFELLTTSLEEGKNAGYSLQDEIGYAGKDAQTQGCIPIYRFVNRVTGNHFYSADRAETPANYILEGIGFYAWPVKMRALKYVRFRSPSEKPIPRSREDQKIWEELDYVINPFEKKSKDLANEPLKIGRKILFPKQKVFFRISE